jgi:hypothetical protein
MGHIPVIETNPPEPTPMISRRAKNALDRLNRLPVKAYRVSTEQGDTYRIEATSLEAAIAEAKRDNDCRVTVYEIK